MPNPFGIELGSTPTSEMAAYHVNFRHVPKAHPDFVNYFGEWRPNDGLVKILASSSIFEGDPYANQARALYDKVKRQLIQVYGDCEAFEFLVEDAVFDGDRDFVAALDHGDRHHLCKWTAASNDRLDSGIAEITLTIVAVGFEDAQVMVAYSVFGSDDSDDQSQSAGTMSL